jgi:hypothetical protein
MKRINLLLPILLVVISILPLLDLLHPGLPITHDGQDHVARIANFYASLREGNIVPRWAGNLNWGYGHPILMFLYPMSSYIGALFHFLGFSFVASVKLVFAVAYIASGMTMYLWLKEEIGGSEGKERLAEVAGFIGALLYLFAPYRFVDLYVRGAIGEHMAFVFPPLVFYFLLKLSKKYSFWYTIGGSLSFAGLILSHNAISLMFLPIIGLYFLYLFFQVKHKNLFAFRCLLIGILGFGLSAFFWMPAFMEGKYTLRDIVTSNDYASRFVQLKDFLYGPWSYGGTDVLSKQVGIIQWVGILLGMFFVVKALITHKRNAKQRILVGSLLIFITSFIIMTEFAKPIWDHITLLQKFQFPWRFLSVTAFSSAVIGAIAVDELLLDTRGKRMIQVRAFVVLFCMLGLLFLNENYWHPRTYLNKSEMYFAGIYSGTTDTGESSPIWSVRFMEKRPTGRLEVVTGKAIVGEITRNSTTHSYYVIADTKTRFRENTVYFPGWHIYVDDKEVPIEFQDPQNRGLLTFNVNPGKHDIVVLFTETKLRLIADIISVTSAGLLVCSGGLFILRRKRNKIL